MHVRLYKSVWYVYNLLTNISPSQKYLSIKIVCTQNIKTKLCVLDYDL